MNNLDSFDLPPNATAPPGTFVVAGLTSRDAAPELPLANTPLGELPAPERHSRPGNNCQAAMESELPVTWIQPSSVGRMSSLLELVKHVDLLQFLVRREIKVRYAQSAIGIGWAVLQPLFPMLIFTVIFGRLAKLSSDGIPYALFSFAGLVPWLYFSNGVTDGVNSLIANANMLSKVYFPRLLIPLSAVISRFIDFCVATIMLLGMMVWYGAIPNWGVCVIPWLLAMMILTTIGIACWLSTLAIQYRDVKHALSFLIQVLMYTAPVVYPTTLIPESWKLLYALNPMVGVIEGLRSALLGTRDMPWLLIAIGSVSSLVIAISGTNYFVRKQRIFADVA
ncbi:MAG: ABC transporter permease [Pirellulaceae bacterium]